MTKKKVITKFIWNMHIIVVYIERSRPSNKHMLNYNSPVATILTK